MVELDFRGEEVELAEEVERLRYGGFWRAHDIIRDFPKLDTLDVLSAVAARTNRIALGTAVLQVPLYQPVDLAKRVVTVDHLSHGRFIFGVGTGWLEREFHNLGVPFRQRAGRTDEALEIMKRLWTEEGEIAHAGRYYSLKEAIFLPKPVQRPHPKIVVGGVWHGTLRGQPGGASGYQREWSERAITRIARYGDGWIAPSSIPLATAAEVLKEGVERIKERGRELGRRISDEEFLLVAETGFINVDESRARAREAAEAHYRSKERRGFYQVRGNPSLETHLVTGAYGEAEEVADFVRRWLAVKKEVPSLKRIQLNIAAMNAVEQLRRFHDRVFPLIEAELQKT